MRRYRAGQRQPSGSGTPRKLADVLPRYLVGVGRDAPLGWRRTKIKCGHCQRVIDSYPRQGHCVVRRGRVLASCSCGKSYDEPAEEFFTALRSAAARREHMFLF